MPSTPRSFTKATLYYFSGTGNTQVIAERVAAKLTEKGLSATAKRIEETGPVSLAPGEAIGIGFPIAAGTTYRVAWEFIRKLPAGGGAAAFGFCTMGGASLWGIIGKLHAVLAAKGYQPLGFEQFQMPPNLFLELPQAMSKNRRERSLVKAGRFAEALASGRARWRRHPVATALMFPFVTWIWQLTEAAWHQRLFKMKVNQALCNKCGLCVKKCPTHNITLQDKVVVGDRCQYCFRCSAVCPVKAIDGILTPRSMHYRAEGSHL